MRGDSFDVIPLLTETWGPGWCTACVTDPPYAKEHAWMYWEMARLMAAALKRGGSYLAIVPHFNIPEITEMVGKFLKWRWMHCMDQEEGAHPRMAMGIEVTWKPIGWWVNEAWPQGRGFVRDSFKNPQPSKKLHKWEQTEDWARFCLKMVPRGGVVVDPFMGSATSAVACWKAGYPYLGVEIDEDAYGLALQRVREI